MERFSPGDNVLFGHRNPRSFEGSENARFGNSDMDFSDVFGGPPRRYSMQEMKMRYSFCGEALDSVSEDESTFSPRDNRAPWPGLNEKPVFGGESPSRRRHTSNDFFDDIFKGDESYSSPRRTDRGPFGSAPASRALSPARPLPPKAEPFGTSFPAQFSLPANLTTAMDSPVLATSNFSSEKNKDGLSSGMSNQQISKASFSKFLNRAINGKNEARGDRHFYRQSPLSREVFLTSEESPNVVKSDEKDKGSKFRKESENVESAKEENQFHFSIYKWAGGGVPFMISLRAGKSSEVEQKSKLERISSSNGRIESNNLDIGRNVSGNTDAEPAAKYQSASGNAEPKSLKVESKKDDKRINQDETQSDSAVKDDNSEVLESKLLNGINKTAVFGNAVLKSGNEVQPSPYQVERDDNFEKEVPKNVSRASRPDMKRLGELLSDKADAQGNSNEENESVVKGTRDANWVHISNKEKKNDTRTKIYSKKLSVNKDSPPGSPITSWNTPAKSGVRGKVKEFVKIFNNETIGKTKVKVDNRSQSSRFIRTDKYGVDSEGSSIDNRNEKVQPSKEDNMADVFSKVEENPDKESMKKSSENPGKESMKQPSNLKAWNHRSSRHTDQKDASSFSGSSHRTSKVTSRSTEDIFQGSFSVEELCNDLDKGLQTSGDSEQIQASNAKIQQWSNGRKGNIRSLLSTLQLVLWPGSGWKPVPLVDIIEASAVKRAYQRALLCLHPDKLQQKDASAYEKYIAEKVFGILQEAWDHFNSLGGI